MKTQKTTVSFQNIREEEHHALKEIWKTGTAADQRHPLKTDAFKEFKEDHNPAKRDCDSPREWSCPPPHREASIEKNVNRKIATRYRSLRLLFLDIQSRFPDSRAVAEIVVL